MERQREVNLFKPQLTNNGFKLWYIFNVNIIDKP